MGKDGIKGRGRPFFQGAFLTSDLQQLAQRCWDIGMQAEPMWATVLGDHRYDDRLPDLSAESQAATAAAYRDLASDAQTLAPDGLTATDRNTRAMLISESLRYAEVLEARLAEFTVTPISSGPQAQLLQVAPLATLPEPEHAEAMVTRYAAAGRFLQQGCERLREGMAAGRLPVRILVDQTIAQIDGYLATSLADDHLLSLTPPDNWDGAERWREALAATVRDAVRPAMAMYRDFLRDEVSSAARDAEHAGVCWLPDGDEVYARCMREHTTLSLEGESVHRMGHDAIAALDEEYRVIGSRVFGDIDRAGVFERLIGDESLRYETADQIVADAEAALARASAAVGGWFGRLPSTTCAIEPQNASEAASGILAFYMPPAPDGSRRGTYKINTSSPQTSTRFDAEAIAFHEALPGHHLQIALAQELDLPEFRRQSVTSSYTEGWGLYTERLADEMGLYSDELQRLGMLAADSLRSSRLVVDTGIHALGWSRQQAINYLTANTPIPVEPATAEIDRYIGLPAQALAYKIGQATIFRLRAEAEAALGARFDIRQFHDVVLAEGAVSLDVLEANIREWVGAAD